MLRVVSVAALVSACWLGYLGYERQESLAGKTDTAMANLGRSINGSEQPTTHMRFYLLAGVLAAVGVCGLGLSKK